MKGYFGGYFITHHDPYFITTITNLLKITIRKIAERPHISIVGHIRQEFQPIHK